MFRLDLDTRQEDAAHLRHARRCGGAVPGRRHAGVLVDGHRSRQADRRPKTRATATSTTSGRSSLKTGELRQYTDALGQPVDGRAEGRRRRTRWRSSPTTRATTAAHARAAASRSPRPPRPTSASPGRSSTSRRRSSHTLVKANQKKKGTFEKMFLDGRPPVNVGVTSGGDFFGGTRSRSATCSATSSSACSSRRSRSTARCRCRTSTSARRFQYADAGLLADAVLLRPSDSVFYDAGLSPFIDRDCAMATRTLRGGTAFGIYPFNRYSRVEVSGGFVQLQRRVQRPDAPGVLASSTQIEQFGTAVFRNGTLVPLGVTFVQEDDGVPRVRPAGRQHHAPLVRGRAEDRQHAVAPDGRRRRALLSAARRQRPAGAARRRASTAGATSPTSSTSAATPRCAATNTSSSSATKARFLNAELRFPLIEAMLTPIGVLGGIRGVFFANIGGAHFKGQPFKFATSGDERYQPAHRLRLPTNPTQPCQPVYGPPQTDQRLPAARRPRVIRRRPRELRARASRSTSTSRGRRCSTRTGRTCSSPRRAAAARSASRSSRSGSATTSSSLDRLATGALRPTGVR